MKLRLRGPDGSSVVEVDPSDTISTLRSLIREKTSLEQFDVKYGYPPRPFDLESYDESASLNDLDVKLNGEQLTIVAKELPQEPQPQNLVASTKARSQGPESNFSSAKVAPAEPTKHERKTFSLKRSKGTDLDAPELPLPEQSATMTLRIMPDDNSCLFRAFGSVYMGTVDGMTELRSLIAQTIQEQPNKYSAAVLDQKPDDYCIWIQTEDAWGGGIELSILSEHFNIEICSIDVQSLRVDRFNEGQPQRCILVYSGIHYDAIALSPSSPPHKYVEAPPEMDIKVFDANDDIILIKAIELCQILQKKHYFTDTNRFTIKCTDCGTQLEGEKGALDHAASTGHTNFGEA